MKLLAKSALGLSALALAPLFLTAPQASADPVNPPPINIIGVPPVDSDELLAATVMYDPPPDDAVSDGMLADPNAPEPVPYVTVPDPTSTPESHSNQGDCRWFQTARWLKPADGVCPAPHWRTGWWYVEDKTTVAWPVKAAIDKWNAGTNIMKIGYGCPTFNGQKYHCVQVVQGRYGTTKPNDWVGQASVYIDPDTHEIMSATIKLNDSYRMGWAGHMQGIVHELGHVAGLGHEMTNVGPMWYQIDGKHQTPNNAEFGQLNTHNYNFA